MNVTRCFIMTGLVGLLTGCVTRVDTGYVRSYVPAYSTSTCNSSPVYDVSPAYYAAPVSGYSTTTICDSGFPVYMDTCYPHYSYRHHRPPPPRFGHRPHNHGGYHRGHVVHGSVHGGKSGHGRRMPSGLCAQPPNGKPTFNRTSHHRGRGARPTKGRRK